MSVSIETREQIVLKTRALSREFLSCAGTPAILVSKKRLIFHMPHFSKIIYKSLFILLSVSILFFLIHSFLKTGTHSSEAETEAMISVGMNLFSHSDPFLNITCSITDSEIIQTRANSELPKSLEPLNILMFYYCVSFNLSSCTLLSNRR